MSISNTNRPTKRVAIIQSCYIPWKGFFDLIGRCDEYVILDRAQYVKRHWHNRNRIKTANGVDWLTIPVLTKGRFEQPIDEVEIEKNWAEKHWRTIEMAYRRAPYFETYASSIKNCYEQAASQTLLTEVNLLFLVKLCTLLDLKTRIVRDTTYPASGIKTARLLDIAKAAGATSYLSGPSARAYFDEALFAQAGIGVEWMSYVGYPQYQQIHGEFDHAVSILDLIFNAGPQSPQYMQAPRQ